MGIPNSRPSQVVSRMHIAQYLTLTRTRTQTYKHTGNGMVVLEGWFSCVVWSTCRARVIYIIENMAHSRWWHGSIRYGKWLVYTRDKYNLHVWHDVFICVLWDSYAERPWKRRNGGGGRGRYRSIRTHRRVKKWGDCGRLGWLEEHDCANSHQTRQWVVSRTYDIYTHQNVKAHSYCIHDKNATGRKDRYDCAYTIPRARTRAPQIHNPSRKQSFDFLQFCSHVLLCYPSLPAPNVFIIEVRHVFKMGKSSHMHGPATSPWPRHPRTLPYIYIYIYTYIYIHINVHMHIKVYINILLHICTYIYIYT